MTDHAYQLRQSRLGNIRFNWKPYICALILMAAWAYVSEMDYQDAVGDQCEEKK